MIRHIKVGEQEVFTRLAMCNFLKASIGNVMLSMKTNKEVLIGKTGTWGNKVIPEGFIKSREPVGTSGWVSNEGNLAFVFTHSGEDITEVVMASIISAVADYGVETFRSPHRPESNDLVFDKDGVFKNFSSWIFKRYNDETANMQGFVSLEIDEEVKQLLPVMLPERQALMPEGSSISDFIGGLKEMNAGIGDELIDKVALEYATRMGEEIVEDQFTEEEMAEINDIADCLRDQNWVENEVKPNISEEFNFIFDE